MNRFMSSGQIRFLPSDQSDEIVKTHQATASHLIVSAFAAMGLLFFMGRNNIVYLRLERERAARVGLRVGKVPRRWILVKEETGEYDSRHSKTYTTLISFLLRTFSQLFNEMS
jgi:hypothetical protein